MEEPSAIVFGTPELLAHIFGFCALPDVSALRRVCKQWRDIRFVMHDPAPPDETLIDVSTLAIHCARNGNIEALEELIVFCGPARAFTFYIDTGELMLESCRFGRAQIVRRLLGIANMPPWDHQRLLRAACKGDHEETLNCVLAYFGLKFTRDSDLLLQVFYYACRSGYIQATRCLADRFEGAAPDDWSANHSPLREACEWGQLDVAKCLVDRFTFAPDAVFGALLATCAEGFSNVLFWLVDTCELPPMTAEHLRLLTEVARDSGLDPSFISRFGPGV